MELAALERADRGVGHVVLKDPAGRNAFDDAMRAAIADALRRAFEDTEIRAIVVGPEGQNFSVGGDLGQLSDHPAGQPSHQLMRSVAELALLVGRAPKPVVANVRGHCIGAGAGFALLCDLVVMERSASMTFPFLRIGLVPDFGTSWSLPRRIGLPLARQALITGKSFMADEALKVGLVDEIAQDGVAWEIANARAQALANAPAAALLQLRLMLREQPSSLTAALESEAVHQALCFGSPDLEEGVAAFLEKRKPDFVASGRGS